MSLLEVDDIHSYYEESHVLQGVSLSVEADETVALIGRNGVGKTTTLRSILQLTPPRRGTVTYDGVDVTGRPTHEVARMGVGWVPEERRMFSHLTVDETLRIATPPGGSVEAAFETAYDAFPDLRDHRGRETGDLSGGQQQMVAIARGLVGDNDLLLVEQNFPLAMDLADRFYLLDHGTVVESGSTSDVSRDDEVIRRYLSA